MQLKHILSAATLAAAGLGSLGFAQSASFAPWNHVSLCVTTSIGACGLLCEPFSCVPNYTLVSSNEKMHVDVAGAPGTFYALVGGIPVWTCLAIPGIEGALAVWQPQTIAFGLLYDFQQRPDLPCGPSQVRLTLDTPMLEPGYDFRLQLLGMNGYAREWPELSFSRPVEVRTR
jgi:hypothetical protein